MGSLSDFLKFNNTWFGLIPEAQLPPTTPTHRLGSISERRNLMTKIFIWLN